MNARFVLITLSITIAVLSLTLFIAVVGATASSVGGEAIGIEADALRKDETDSRPLAYQRPHFSQDEPLSLTGPISIYLPLMEYDYDPSSERAALMAIYYSTNGSGWIDNTGWGTEASYCEWFGVTCNENGQVTNLVLSGNMLSGTLPSEIGNLSELIDLRLNGTEYLCPVRYNLRGPIPPSIGKLLNLQRLNLYCNQLNSLPPEIGNLENLWVLNMSGNQLTSLPPEIGNLENLWVLELWGNQLVSLPSEFGNLAGLKELNLSGNQLTSLPPGIGNLENLWSLELSYNQLVFLPPEIGNLVGLGVLRLTYTKLSGSIPAFLSNLASLSDLYLDGNPDLTCWETEEAYNWAMSLKAYFGPTCYFP